MSRTSVDLLIVNIGQLLTLMGPSRPRVGKEQADLGIMEGGAVAVQKGKIHAVGPAAALRQSISAKKTIDAKGQVVTPGLVDPHTHLAFMGTREMEFELRWAGASGIPFPRCGRRRRMI